MKFEKGGIVPKSEDEFDRFKRKLRGLKIEHNGKRIVRIVGPEIRQKRFSVCSFPSLYGTPWRTDSIILARIFQAIREISAVFRWIFGRSPRIVEFFDRKEDIK